MESSTNISLVPFNILLEETREDKFITDGTATAYSLTNLNATNDTIQVYRNNVLFLKTVATAVRGTTKTNWTVSGSTLTFSNINDIPSGTLITVRHTQSDFLLLDGTDSSSSDAGHKIESNTTNEILDDPYFKRQDKSSLDCVLKPKFAHTQDANKQFHASILGKKTYLDSSRGV